MNMKQLNDVGVIGLGVMGASLARNLASRGYHVAGFNLDASAARKLAAAHPEAGLAIADSLEVFVRSLARPRQIILLVPAGDPVDAVLEGLAPFLEAGDVAVDSGNSHYLDTERRLAKYLDRSWRFMGMGVSGGEEGALRGPALMPGGEPEAFETLRPVLEAIAAVSDAGPCVAHCGRGAAGHFVKMVHNGIEYGDMQLIAEVVLLLRRGLGYSAMQTAEVFARWNHSELEGYLVEITADALATPDPVNPGASLVDAILDRAGQKGTGKWTVQAGAELGVSIPTIAAAVEARLLSAKRELRLAAAARFPGEDRPLSALSIEDLQAALYVSKIASYTQGFALLQTASQVLGFGTDLAEVARIWTAGCIIRARFLGEVRQAFQEAPGLELLAFAPTLRKAIQDREPAWRRVVGAAAAAGLPTPGLSASLAWFDGLRNSFGSVSIIQAQRDLFGSHTYERSDHPGVAVHSLWGRFAR
jgi:6-phosphogluconate dehydrogenase